MRNLLAREIAPGHVLHGTPLTPWLACNACDDVLVVGHRHRSDVARHLRRHREQARRDEGVVGRLEAPGVIPIEAAAGDDCREEDHADDGGDRMAAQRASASFAPALIPGLLLPVRLVGRRIRAIRPAILCRRASRLAGILCMRAADLVLDGLRSSRCRTGRPLRSLQDQLLTDISTVSVGQHDQTRFGCGEPAAVGFVLGAAFAIPLRET